MLKLILNGECKVYDWLKLEHVKEILVMAILENNLNLY